MTDTAQQVGRGALTNIFQDEHVAVTLENGCLHLAWAKDVVDGPEAVDLARRLTHALGRVVREAPPKSMTMLIDLMVIRKPAPRANAVFLEWLRRDWRSFRSTAFASRNTLLRSTLKVASLLPGIHVSGFSTVEEARAHLEKQAALEPVAG